MNENQRKIISQVMIQLNNDKITVPTEEELKTYIDIFAIINPVNNDEKEEVVREIFSRLNIRMDMGSIVKYRHKPWYMNAKSSIDDRYWRRYRDYLLTDKAFAPETVNAIDKSTDIMMDLFGNPKEEQGFSQRGLVIGDVQSGKTSTYTALINKAADAGYRVIILLTGTIEKLRQQTQSRLDEGFVGLDSSSLMQNKKTKIQVGVGEKDGSFSAACLTSTEKDFNTSIAKNLNIQITTLEQPVIFVLKKNKSVLEKLEQWLTTYNNKSGQIVEPMLLIDDEADNASVNTRKDDEDPTTINKCIRKLLKVFTHSTYVAFTATPYANIFINPDTDDEMLKDDLFPRDFIYSLDSPTNYIGAKSIFSEDGKHHYMIHNNDDCEEFAPEKHKKDFEPNVLPLSLKEALCSFFIANAIRDLRGEGYSHRSMLINISRFISVQGKISDLVEDFVINYKMIYKNYGKLGQMAESHKEISFTKRVYEKYFLSLDSRIDDKGNMFTWDDVQKQISKSCQPIVVRTVNGANSKKNLNYEENEEFGLRVIAVGGFSLSRGLTLEGLSTSYFYRNSKMYDTLMQMGRWFGYRKGYADLCQVWIGEKSEEWYEYISEAQDDLKHEIKRMMNANATPKDFGLGVRNDKNSLWVTALNKMRNSKEYIRTISLCGSVAETVYIDLDEKLNRKNNDTINSWLNRLFENGYKTSTTKEVNGITAELDQLQHKQILSINSNYVVELLRSFNVNKYNFDFQPDNIIEMIENDNHKSFAKWDVIIADNSSNSPIKICDYLSLGPINRSFTINEELKYIKMSGSKSRIGSNNYAKGGLTKEETKIIEEKAKNSRLDTEKNGLNQNDYFNTGFKRNPLLIIYPVSLNKNTKVIEHPDLIKPYKDLVYGLAVGFPSIDGKKKITYKYKINNVKWKELMGIDSFDEEYEEEIEDEND